VALRALLHLEEPELATHLEKIQFLPELYALTWFLNLFSMVFDVTRVKRLWDFILFCPHFSIAFALSILLDVNIFCDIFSFVKNLIKIYIYLIMI
jgi:hypothetical protein